MRRHERLRLAIGEALPAAGWALLVGMGAVLVALAPRLRPTLSARSFAWLSALPVLVWLARHARAAAPGPRHARERDGNRELAFELRHGREASRGRHAEQRRGAVAYTSRSHSGERPRFD